MRRGQIIVQQPVQLLRPSSVNARSGWIVGNWEVTFWMARYPEIPQFWSSPTVILICAREGLASGLHSLLTMGRSR